MVSLHSNDANFRPITNVVRSVEKMVIYSPKLCEFSADCILVAINESYLLFYVNLLKQLKIK